MTTYVNPPAAPPVTTEAGALRIQTVAYTVTRTPAGTVEATWDKQRYFDDREGLSATLREAGFPVLIKGQCVLHGTGRRRHAGSERHRARGRQRDQDGVRGGRQGHVRVRPSAVPAGKQLFIGYLSPAQLAVTHGAPGSVERLVSTGAPLTCTTTAPPAHRRPGEKAGWRPG